MYKRHHATQDKLDKLKMSLDTHLSRPGPVSIPEIAREFGVTRQAISYRLKLLERSTGTRIPANRRCPQVQPMFREELIRRVQEST